MNKSLRFGIVFLILSCVSCFKDPGFSVIPAITYKSIRFIKSDSGQSSIEIVMDFEDGDGDLGLSDSDTLNPFNPIPKYDSAFGDNIETNPNRTNYNVTYLIKKDSNEFKSCDYSPDSCTEKEKIGLGQIVGSGFGDLNPDRKARPLSGVLTYNLKFFLRSSYLDGKTIKLKIYIKDRALNNSNTIETDTLLIQ